MIIGGESGGKAKARPFDIAWARSLVQQAKDAGVATFVKQLGTNPIEQVRDYTYAAEEREDPRPITLKDGHGGEMHEWPADLQVRQFPEVLTVPA